MEGREGKGEGKGEGYREMDRWKLNRGSTKRAMKRDGRVDGVTGREGRSSKE